MKSNWFEKIELGTAQFGLDYGINNGKKVSENTAKNIITILNAKSNVVVDTAPSYGDSEVTTRKIINQNNRVISKLLPLKAYTVDEILDALKKTCEAFEGNLYGMMVHDINDVFSPDFEIILHALNELRNDGVKIGVSIYNLEQLYSAHKIINLDMVQVPLNLLDQRFDNLEFIEFIDEECIEVHVRSIFLQGLLLMNNDKIPTSLMNSISYIEAIDNLATSLELAIYDLCLLYVFNKPWVNYVLTGLDSAEQTEALINRIKQLQIKEVNVDFSSLECMDEKIINPVMWSYDN